MTRRVRVFARMLVRRAVAAQGNATLLAGPEMDPLRADFHALSAFGDLGMLHRINGVEMRAAAIGHNYFVLLFEARRR